MKYALKTCVAALALMATAPAAADVVYNGNTYGEGDSFNIDFVGSAGDQFEGLEASLSLTLTDITDAGDYLFTYMLTNTTTDPGQPSAELSAFGFVVDPNDLDVTATGDLAVATNNNISNGVQLTFCLTAGNSTCNGGSSNGAGNGESFDGTFLLAFGGDPGLVTLTDPTVRFQSTGDGEGSAIGTPPPVPEPGTWAMMLMGFGAAGYAIRRRRRSAELPQVA